MFKPQAHGHSKLAGAVVVSALFLSLSAHAGLLGVGSMSTGATGTLVGSASGRLGVGTPMPAIGTGTLNAASMNAASASANAAAQATGQARVQGVFAAPPALAAAAPVSQTSHVSVREGAVVNTGDDVTVQAERATRKSHAASQKVLEQAGNEQGRVVDQTLRIKQSAEAGANVQVNAARTESAKLGAQASDTATAGVNASAQAGARASTAAKEAVNRGVAVAQSTLPRGSIAGAVSGSGSAQASTEGASVSGQASAGGAVSLAQ